MKQNNILINNYTISRISQKKIKQQIKLFEDTQKCKIKTLNISFIDDNEMISLNKEYLNHEGSTDIITFTYEENIDNLDGEILICVDEAKRQARGYRVKLFNEISRLVFHGLLHLIGYNDQTEEEKVVMNRSENKLLKILEET